ncbi:hypothetical protein QBC46DRAFT_34681 [Diplogelasinospora grovesii]|uniref:Glucan 4-alpha-glucosidase n=1 Tax=Diplogelasinospora grovesii TaxID=303347 RepID=A0AAN6NEU6_9PEZI|nr:hypothetical protein QBC46DRAFT_34681 [Diplogelasinospora grovesii]
MSTPSPTDPPKRPRLSLQIKAIASGTTGRTSRTLAAAVDVKSPTAFNTLSNVYATAVDRSTPINEKPPMTALGSRPSLRLSTQDGPKERRLQTPYLGPYLDTPISGHPISPAVSKPVLFPSAMTATPPMSAVPPEQNGSSSQVFTFENTSATQDATMAAPSIKVTCQTPTTRPSKRSSTMPANMQPKLPYTHQRSLRSILRNSPLPPISTTKSPISPRRQSLRLQEKAARRVAYNSPLCQTITTQKYTKSHIDLLAEDATPTTPSMTPTGDPNVLDQTMAYTGDETRDGGQTPGPFEEMRRRMSTLKASSPLSPTGSSGIRKSSRTGKKKVAEKKRRWVWTIGQDAEDDECGSPVTPITMAAADTVGSKKAVAVVPVPVLGVPSPKRSVPVLGLPTPKKAGAPASAVPVLPVPAPRPRTRSQLQLPLPSALRPALKPALSIPAMQVQVAQAAEVTLTLPATTYKPARTTPEAEPTAVEPPTPSLSIDSTVSCSQDSVFDAQGDVEMSDASSVLSEVLPEDMEDSDMDIMDTDTPTAAKPILSVGI